MFSTRGRYALRVLIDLAKHQDVDGEYIPMKDVAARQGISLKYLEQILPVLSKNNIIEAAHGKGGGYRLVRKPEEYTVREILVLTENGLAPVACLEPDAKPCERVAECSTIKFWTGLNDVVNNYLENSTLKDLLG